MIGITDRLFDDRGIAFRPGLEGQQVAVDPMADGAGNAPDVGRDAGHTERTRLGKNQSESRLFSEDAQYGVGHRELSTDQVLPREVAPTLSG